MKTIIYTVLILWVTCLSVQPVKAGIMEIPGTGANEFLLKKLAEAYNRENPGDAVLIPPSVGSSGGIRLVGEGEKILGRVARPLKKEENKYGLSYLVFAKDPVVFAVSSRVEVNDLTVQQLVDIYSGKIENWQQVGGQDYPVRLLIREPEDSSLLIIKKHLPPFRDLHFSDKAKCLYHDNEMIEMLKKYSTVIGWLTSSSLVAIGPVVNSIAIGGVEPSVENVVSGRYGLVGDYALVFKEKRLDALAKKFIDFIFSKTGAQLLKEAGVIPVSRR